MIRINDEDDGHAIAKHANCRFTPGKDTVIANVSDTTSVLLGGGIFQDYTGASIQVHLAGLHPNWATRDLVWVGFDYCFNQLGCNFVFGLIPSYNSEALTLDNKLGFTEITRIPDVFPDGDLVVMRMRKEECRWLKLRPRRVRSNRLTQ
jgi:hypothetical protein